VLTLTPKKQTKAYPNNKPHITREVKDCIDKETQGINKKHFLWELWESRRTITNMNLQNKSLRTPDELTKAN
jgi:hypothetical protein